ncbi:MAG: chloride channel protein [Caldilineaceae bacterium]
MESHAVIIDQNDRLADFTRDWRILLLAGMAVIVGCISAVVAYLLVQLIALITNLAFHFRFSTAESLPTPDGWKLGVVLIPMLGGLIIGLMAYYGSEKIRGHGIPEALEAILIGRSKLQLKVAILKPLSSAISIGTGGPFGAEGPIIMTGGAFGSLFAQLFSLSATERKILLVAGAAGGMAAIFATPVAAVILAVELLLFEWRPRSFIPVTIAASVAAVLRVPLLGSGPIFFVTPHSILAYATFFWALVIGLVAGIVAAVVTGLVYAFEDLFHRLPIHWMWWPAIGGFCVGIGGLLDPRVMGVGYDTIHTLLRGELTGVTLWSLLIIKALVWSIALGSGTSGGVLAPLLIIGGAVGALEAGFIPYDDAGLWATISMAAVMSGTMRCPLTAIIFTIELTHDLNILPALLIGCVAAYAVTIFGMRRSILTEKVARRGHHLVQEYTVDPFMLVRVSEVMDADILSIPETMTVAELADRIAQGEPALTRHQALPITSATGKLIGIITRGDVVHALGRDASGSMSVINAGSTQLIVTYPDELVHDALAKIVHNNVGRLLVVHRNNPDQLIGYLGRATILNARLQRLAEEEIREDGWLRSLMVKG